MSIVTRQGKGSRLTTQEMDENFEYLENLSKKLYKIYKAVLIQEDNNAPIATILENTFEGEIVWTKNIESGLYTATSSGGEFTEGRTIISTNNDLKTFTSSEGKFVLVNSKSLSPIYGDENEIYLYTTLREGSSENTNDNVLDGINTWIEIKVYS